MRFQLEQQLNRLWYGKRSLLFFLLLPLTFIYWCVICSRSYLYRSGLIASYRPAVPTVVIGNITLGGVGKTPLVAALARHWMNQGMIVGIVSRGYGGSSRVWPREVFSDSDPIEVGDEPVMLAQQLGCVVVVAPRRVEAIRRCEEKGCQIILSDDGLSHYAFERDVECAVFRDNRGVGNGYCLPSGPLRDSLSRLDRVHFTLRNTERCKSADSFYLAPRRFIAVTSNQTREIGEFEGRVVHAVAGIGCNAAFFKLLRSLGCEVIEHHFPDHRIFTASDITFQDNYPVLMTEKDAVKCRGIASSQHWYLRVEAQLDDDFLQNISQLVSDAG